MNWVLEEGDRTVTGQLPDTPTRGLPTRGLDNSRSHRCRQKGKLSTQSRRWHPRVVQSASWQSASWRIHELSSNPRTRGRHMTLSEDLPGTGLTWTAAKTADNDRLLPDVLIRTGGPKSTSKSKSNNQPYQ